MMMTQIQASSATTHKTGYAFTYRKRRSKIDWAGAGIGDAFKANIDYYLRIYAQRLFYQNTKKVQRGVAKMTGATSEPELSPLVKPQISPCYTDYPATLAAYAAIGLTAYLEYRERSQTTLLAAQMAEFLSNPAEADKMAVDADTYKKVAHMTLHWVETRLLLADLASGGQGASAIEIYRLFSASQQNLRFNSLAEIVRSVVLFSDVLPALEATDLHPLTNEIIAKLSQPCREYAAQMVGATGNELLQIGEKWIRAICRLIADYLPPPEQQPAEAAKQAAMSLSESFVKRLLGQPKYGFVQPETAIEPQDKIGPLLDPTPPVLDDSRNGLENVLNSLTGNRSGQNRRKNDGIEESEATARETLAEFAKAMDRAGGQHRDYEDIRSDLLEMELRVSPFNQSPIEGSPTDGHEVQMKLTGGKEAGGEIFDQAVELSDDLTACNRLLEEALPITAALRRCLYPNIQQLPKTQRFRTSGSLDPARLAMGDFAPTIFKRYRILEKADRRGSPLLVIACDGSGSLNYSQMQMVKLLTTAWLESTVKSNIKVLAGLYHSGAVRRGVSGALVQWVYHPHKTAAIQRRDASRTLISLPEQGTGVQSDALSLAYILEEAIQLAKGNMIYLNLISDMAWNQSFHTELSGEEEVCSFFQNAYADLSPKLHTTLVGLGVTEPGPFADILDSVILISQAELENAAAVAEKIGVYVASCVKDRNKMTSQN